MDKMQLAYRYLLISLVLISLEACDQTATISLPKLPPDGVILAFGDSLTYGTGASEGHDYPAVLSQLTRLEVINEGQPGELSHQGLQRLPELLDEYEPDLLILTHGGNDLLKGLSSDSISANLEKMINAAHQRNISVVMLGVPLPRMFLLESAEFYNSLARQKQIPAELDVLPSLLNDNSLKSDLIHPNNKGYQLMAERIYHLLMSSGALNTASLN